ncbi:hypothetical protein J421_0344 [Gemmatirosa kalamazoonensis]|uniref:DUF2946 domain-containing protein n=1 Tax=Gemmatirosa kalamazoonensis TaxID=861299 RepID=W0RAR7_9BACT|nr:hypothetical protein [Gemmatirosa kalamazoonensis]AHG87881.1 hypothetical protein J421_0344 [Gemmatirosa kalamazoonensis]
MRRLRLLRGLSAVLALLHLLVPPLVGIADARLEAEAARSGRAIVHVESHGSPTCPRVHPTDCALCQVVALLATPSRAACALPTATIALAAPVATALGRPTVGRHTLALPRGPPTA